MALRCWFFWAWWLPLMLAVMTAAGEQEEGCSGSGNTCGNLTISDPFWLTDLQTGRSCGSRDFEITCQNNTPVLPSSMPYSYGFEIMDISYEEHSLRVVDLGKVKLLPRYKGCNGPNWNTSDKLHRPFQIDPVNLNLIMYNCTNVSAAARRRDGELVETRMWCGKENHVFFHVEGSYDEVSAVEGCGAVVLPVLGGANGEANASDYERLINNGFILRWEIPPPRATGRNRRHALVR